MQGIFCYNYILTITCDLFVSAAFSMDGFCTMYMRMPMTTTALPIQGKCQLTARKIYLKFPFTAIEFELPRMPEENSKEFDFRIRGSTGDMVMNIKYNVELRCFTGIGKQEDNETEIVRFCFFTERSPMASLEYGFS